MFAIHSNRGKSRLSGFYRVLENFSGRVFLTVMQGFANRSSPVPELEPINVRNRFQDPNDG
ncbi:unnamed protein product [Meloidogyne enterolobii]|uniref:Uncharacterized protein n=1 Tax=Meloidogyne enterolobii TaxID=390850 RepID=A0ACB1AJH4_MELEN